MLGKLKIPLLTLVAVVALDGVAAAGLSIAGRLGGPFAALERRFDEGRSVPGKLALWLAEPDRPGALFDVAWRDDVIARSARQFATADDAPVARGYGMSFLNHIMRAAAELDPSLRIDLHAGPAAPPNYTYALFLDDRANRRPGDVAALGILSSSVHAMAAMSNQTWMFEQPAPFTYPIFLPEGDGLRKIEPSVRTDADERAVMADPARAESWRAELAHNDALYTAAAFAAPWTDFSPLLRQIRRSLARNAAAEARDDVLAERTYPWRTALLRMTLDFVAAARAEGLRPIVALIQTRDPTDPDLLAALGPALDAAGAPYLATAAMYDPRDPSGFKSDGHYDAEQNRRFAARFLELAAAQ